MISVAVMAHPKREGWVPDLVKSIDADVQVVWDRHNDRWDTGRRSLLAYDPAATHHLVVQDDALVCRDLVAGLEEAVEHTGDHPLGLYMGRVRPSAAKVSRRFEQARLTGERWVKMEGPTWGVAIVLPTAQIDAVVEFGDRRPDVPNYDKRIALYYRTVAGLTCWYPVPSLVEHRHGAENPSLIPGRTSPNRRAYLFIGQDTSALDIDWTYRPPEDYMATFRNIRSPHLDPVTAPEGSASFLRLSRMPRIWERIDRPSKVEVTSPGDPAPVYMDGQDNADKVTDMHAGGGWYDLPDGTRVRGRAAAEAHLAKAG